MQLTSGLQPARGPRSEPAETVQNKETGGRGGTRYDPEYLGDRSRWEGAALDLSSGDVRLPETAHVRTVGPGGRASWAAKLWSTFSEGPTLAPRHAKARVDIRVPSPGPDSRVTPRVIPGDGAGAAWRQGLLTGVQSWPTART